MKSMRDEFGTTFVFSTHDPRVMGQAEALFHLEDGKLINAETPDEEVPNA
jgi:putative ABC transport system ATP-binding protein